MVELCYAVMKCEVRGHRAESRNGGRTGG
jgi:hypothetical protein